MNFDLFFVPLTSSFRLRLSTYGAQEGTFARKYSNKFCISLAYSYLCSRKHKNRTTMKQKNIFAVLLMLSAGLLSVKAQVNDWQNWMANLDDNAFVCQLSIPGAHDACSSSFSGWSAIGAAVAGKVQNKSVEQMLPLGVRLFDLRPNNQLNIHHGILQTSYTFNGVMGQLRDYVTNHPTEFCIVLVRHEVEGDSGNDNFADKMQQSLANFSDYLIDFRPNLTVGETRGKILFLSRDDYSGPLRGGKVTDWRDNQSDINNMLGAHCNGPETYKCSLWAQGYYEYTNVDAKKNVIEAMLNKSWQLAGKYDYTWVINSLDGYRSDVTYTNSATQDNAKTVNPYLQNLLASGNYNGPAGLVFMDYCCDGDGSGYYGLSLTKELINHNFRYTMSKQGDPIYDTQGNLYVAPKGQEMMWEAKTYSVTTPTNASTANGVSAPSGWYQPDFDDSNWETRRYPTGTSTNSPYFSAWEGEYNVLFIRREFYIDHDPSIDTYTLYFCHDDDCKIYINGRNVKNETSWISTYSSYNITSARLNIGRNVIAIRQQQNTGGAYFDCGVLRKEGTKAPCKLTSDKWHTFVASGHNVDFSSTNVKAYKIVEILGSSPTFARTEEVTVVPANQAVVVRSENGAGTYQIPVTENAEPLEDNLLKATLGPLDVTQENNIYSIDIQNGFSAFFPVTAGNTVAKGKGYLDLSDSNVKPPYILLDLDDDPTGIEAIQDSGLKNQNKIYKQGSTIVNLAGQRLHKPQRGLNIINGRKVNYP